MNNDQMASLVDAALGYLLPKLTVTAEYCAKPPNPLPKGTVRVPLSKQCPCCGNTAAPIVWVSREALDHEDTVNFVRQECRGLITQLACDINRAGGSIVTYPTDSPQDFQGGVALRVRGGVALRGIALFDGERFGIRFDVFYVSTRTV